MSSWGAAREKWELEQMEETEKIKEAALKGDPEAMEMMAYRIAMIQHNCDDKVIELLSAASDAGRQTASWKLADYYAYLDEEKYHSKIEHYLRLALAKGKRYSDEDPKWIHGNLEDWIEEHHPKYYNSEKEVYRIPWYMRIIRK